jgi:hypothetical protein
MVVDEWVTGIAFKPLCSCGALDPERAPVASLNQAGAFSFSAAANAYGQSKSSATNVKSAAPARKDLFGTFAAALG